MLFPVVSSCLDSKCKVVDCAVVLGEEVVSVVLLVVDLEIAEVVGLLDFL